MRLGIQRHSLHLVLVKRIFGFQEGSARAGIGRSMPVATNDSGCLAMHTSKSTTSSSLEQLTFESNIVAISYSKYIFIVIIGRVRVIRYE
jgi:hypothetical protein